MNYFESQVPILVEGWKRLVLHHDGATTIIPNDIMIEELSCPPLPHEILTLLSIYETSETLQRTIKCDVEKILNNKQEQPSWKSLLKAIEITSSERLYTVVSQNAYRLEPSNNLESRIESQKVLQGFSDVVLESILGLFDCQAEANLEIENLLATNGHSVETYRFIQLIGRYCNLILPYPYKIRFNRKTASHIIDADSSKKQVELANRLKERFSLYRYCFRLHELYIRQVNSNKKTARELDSLLDGKIFDLGATSRSIARKQQRERRLRPDRLSIPLVGNLHQCVFCYRFRFEKLPPQANNPKQHCDRDECIDAYGRWFDHINRKEIRLRRGKVPD